MTMISDEGRRTKDEDSAASFVVRLSSFVSDTRQARNRSRTFQLTMMMERSGVDASSIGGQAVITQKVTTV